MSVLWVPLFFGDAVIGCIELIEKRYVRPFTDYDREFAATIAALASMAIHTARVRRLLEAQGVKLQLLLAASRELAAAVSEQEVLECVARTTGRALDADACFIYLYEAEFETISWVATWQLDPAVIGDPRRRRAPPTGSPTSPPTCARPPEGRRSSSAASQTPSCPRPSAASSRSGASRRCSPCRRIVDGEPVGQLEVTHVRGRVRLHRRRARPGPGTGRPGRGGAAARARPPSARGRPNARARRRGRRAAAAIEAPATRCRFSAPARPGRRPPVARRRRAAVAASSSASLSGVSSP